MLDIAVPSLPLTCSHPPAFSAVYPGVSMPVDSLPAAIHPMVCFCLPAALLALLLPLFAQIASTCDQIDRFAALRGLGATSLARHHRSRHLIGIVPQRSGQLCRAPWSSASLSISYQQYQREYRPLLPHSSHVGGTHMRKHLLTLLSQQSHARIP